MISRKHKDPLHLVSVVNGAIPVIGKITDTEDKLKLAAALQAAVPVYGNLERYIKKLSIIQDSSPETSGNMNSLEEAKNTIALFERLYGNAETGASGLSHGRKIKDNVCLQDIITSLKNKTKQSKKTKIKDLGEDWSETVPILRVCTDGKVKGKIDKKYPYGDLNHKNKTAYFESDISADEIPYIVLPGADTEEDRERNDRYIHSLGVIVRKKKNKNEKDDYLFCVVAETGPAKIEAGNLVRDETRKKMSSPKREKEVENTLGEVSIYAAWILKGLDVSSLKTIKIKLAQHDKYTTDNYNIGNTSVEEDGIEYEIIIIEKSAPISGGHRSGWYDDNKDKNAKKFRQKIVDRGKYILKIYNKDAENTKIERNCLNPEERKKTGKKTTVKKALKKITAFCLLILLLTGCQKPATKETESVAVKEEPAQTAITVPEKQEPVQAKEKKLSEIYDWENARIIEDPRDQNFEEGQVLQNQDYVFYPEDGCKIARISKTDGSKKIICRFNPAKKIEDLEHMYIHYCLSDDGLFIEYNGDVYSCGFDGKNLYKIISRKKLKKQVTAIEPDAWYYGNADSLKFHQGSLYLSIGNIIWKLDLETKKITKMSGWSSKACFCGSTLYYNDSSGGPIYKTDIHTGKSSCVIKKKCYTLTEIDGELYYMHNLNIYMYRKGKKDKKIFSFGEKIKMRWLSGIDSDSGKIAVTYSIDERYSGICKDMAMSSVAIYDIRTSAFSKIDNIRGLTVLKYFASDMLFYSTTYHYYGGIYISFLSYPQPARDKTFKITKESITQPGNTEYTPQESQEEKLSDKYDWNNAKITNDYDEVNVPDLVGSDPVLQNENYIFYLEDGCKIIRINKKDKTVKVVCRFDLTKKKHRKTNIRFCLSDSGLFISYAGSIYFCGFEGEDFHKILSRKKLNKMTAHIYTMYFYKDSLYLSSYHCIYRLDLETKKGTKISGDNNNPIAGCLCGNMLYYTQYMYESLHMIDIHTGRHTLISDKGDYAVTESDGKLYYLEHGSWEKATIYMYRKGKKDKKIWESGIAVTEAYCTPGKIAMRYCINQKYDLHDNNILIYDIKTSTITKIENIPDFYSIAGLSGDMLFYTKNWNDKYLSCMAY